MTKVLPSDDIKLKYIIGRECTVLFNVCTVMFRNIRTGNTTDVQNSESTEYHKNSRHRDKFEY